MTNSVADFANWGTLGTVDLISGTFNPDEPLSAEHLLNSLGLATIAAGGMHIYNSLGATDMVSGIGSADLAGSVGDAEVWRDVGGIVESENIEWPPNNGAVLGTEKNVVLTKGYQFDRYGLNKGSYVSPVGTPYEMRSLAPGTEFKPYKVFKVIKPVRAQGSVVAPWFDQQGGGIQFQLNNSIQELLDLRRIIEVTK